MIDIAAIKLTLSVAEALLQNEPDIYAAIHDAIYLTLIREYLPQATISELMMELELTEAQLKEIVRRLP